MTSPSHQSEPSFKSLQERWEDTQEALPSDLNLRLRRALSWLDRAERERDDDDAAFIFYWIAFTTMYSTPQSEGQQPNEPSRFYDYFGRIVSLDAGNVVYRAICEQFSDSMRLLLNNKYVFGPFWKDYHGSSQHRRWEKWFENDRRAVTQALRSRDTQIVLSMVFDRLYVLRNQMLHGAATWDGSKNRAQVRDGARIMEFLTPQFIRLMMDNPKIDWGAPAYPVVND